MKKYSPLEKMTSVWLIFILLIQQSGCVASRTTISPSELPESGKGYYIVHGKEIKYLIEDVTVSDGKLSGKINTEGTSFSGDKTHLWLRSDSVARISPGSIITIPVDGIEKVEVIKESKNKTVLLVVGCVLVVLLIAAGASMGDLGVLPDI